jgi:5'/3'-nucleotidase SurE
MRILITNDDGIQSLSILRLAEWAKKLGEVTVVAPKIEQSGKSQAIEFHHSFEIKKVDFLEGCEAYTVDSTPADCVRIMTLGLKEQFDLVLSGINRGLNVGSDIMYSGTVAAVFEASNLGMKAIAVSTDPGSISTAWEHLNRVWEYFQQHKLLERHDCYNVNIPSRAGDIRITRQGGPYFSDDFQPEENDFYLPKGIPVYAPSNCCFDTDTVLTNHQISVMPLTCQRVDFAAYEDLKSLNEG